MRCHIGEIRSPLDDIRGAAYAALRNPDLATWPDCQRFAAERREQGSNGILYRSARRDSGECIGAFRPRSISLPQQGQRLRYHWNGARIDRVMAVGYIRVL